MDLECKTCVHVEFCDPGTAFCAEYTPKVTNPKLQVKCGDCENFGEKDCPKQNKVTEDSIGCVFYEGDYNIYKQGESYVIKNPDMKQISSIGNKFYIWMGIYPLVFDMPLSTSSLLEEKPTLDDMEDNSFLFVYGNGVFLIDPNLPNNIIVSSNFDSGAYNKCDFDSYCRKGVNGVAIQFNLSTLLALVINPTKKHFKSLGIETDWLDKIYKAALC